MHSGTQSCDKNASNSNGNLFECKQVDFEYEFQLFLLRLWI